MVAEGYKQTEIGVMPTNWLVKDIGSILHIRHGKSQKEVEVIDGKYPILGTGGEIGRTNHSLYSKPSVLIGRKGTIDKPSYMDTPFWTVDTLFYSEINQNTHAKFIYYKFSQINWYSYNEASGVPSLNAKTIENIFIAIPPTIAEQKAIATALSDTDELLNSLEKLIAKKEAVKTATMQKLLTPKEGWKVFLIEDIAQITTGNKNTQDKKNSGKYPFFVRSQTIERINSYSFDGEAVLTAGDGVGTGKVFHYINGKFDAHQRVYLISGFKERINGYYFYLYFSNNFYSRMMQMTAKSSVDSVRREMIAKMPIPIPPTIVEQQAIATILSDMDSDIETLKSKLSKIKAIKEGMMQELLTGRIRLHKNAS